MLPSLSIYEKHISKLPIVSVIIANTIPLYGVFFLGWEPLAVLMLFWSESVVMGFYCVLKILAAPLNRINILKKVVGIPVFLWFFGWFASGYAIFIIVLLIIFPQVTGRAEVPGFETLPEEGLFVPSWPGLLALFELGIDSVIIIYHILPLGVILMVGIMLIRYGVAFVIDYLIMGGREKTDIGQLVGEPMVRLCLLHLPIMISGFLIIYFLPGKVVVTFLMILKSWFEANQFRKDRSPTMIEINDML